MNSIKQYSPLKNGILLSFSALLFILTLAYSIQKYTYLDDRINEVEFVLNEGSNVKRTLVYIKEINDINYNFSNQFKPLKNKENNLVFDLKSEMTVREIRLYFIAPTDYFSIKKIVLKGTSNNYNVDLKKIKISNGIFILDDEGEYSVKSERPYSYIELDKTYFYSRDILRISIAILVSILILTTFFLFAKRSDHISFINKLSLKELSFALFLLTIFLPHPINNVFLIISFLFLLRSFNLDNLLINKIALLFIAYFVNILFNNIFISEAGFDNFHPTETALPFLILPLFFTCVNSKIEFLKLLPISALVLSLLLFLTSLVNALVLENLLCFSFEEFSKYLHAVYLSYLLSFSIFYLYFSKGLDPKYNYAFQGVLFFFLILAGSKLIIVFTVLIYVLIFVNSKKKVLIIILPIVLFFGFSPIQKRFKEIINLKDLSVVAENRLKNPNDPRVNGLTLRLMLWQESIRSVDTFSEIMFGLGVGDKTNKILIENIEKRGLGLYKKYSSHNQFINTFMRTGICGVLILISVLFYSFSIALKYKNKLLLITVLLFTFAMITESVLQRALGITFFITVILLLFKQIKLNESSNNRN